MVMNLNITKPSAMLFNDVASVLLRLMIEYLMCGSSVRRFAGRGAAGVVVDIYVLQTQKRLPAGSP